ncbi:hypothetical protein BVX99_02295 [bacterium F16]|nr:hypothetical protein BVX99_02295 [bacterium F16]
MSRLSIPLISTDDAWAHLKQLISPLPTESLALSDAMDCYLADTLSSDRDLPPQDRAASDGYAILCEDTHHGPTVLKVIDETAHLTPGTCLRVITGNPTPLGCSAVVPEKDIDITDDTILIKEPILRSSHILKQAHFSKKGTPLLEVGKQLKTGHLGLCAAIGHTSIPVVRRPKVAIISYGQNLVDCAAKPDKYQLREMNGTMFKAALSHALYEVTTIDLVSEDPVALKQSVTDAMRDADAILVTGGMSAEQSRLLPTVITQLGGTIYYDGINIKPGQRQLLAKVNEQILFGLPGSSIGGLVGLHEFVLPALRLLSGCSYKECIPSIRLPLMRTVQVGGTREHRILVKLQNTKYGPGLIPLSFTSSSDLVSASKADGAARIEYGRTSVAAGQYVDFRPWGSGNFSNHCSTIGDQYVGANG